MYIYYIMPYGERYMNKSGRKTLKTTQTAEKPKMAKPKAPPKEVPKYVEQKSNKVK